MERNQNTTTEDLRSTAAHDREEETNYEMNYVNNIMMVQMKVSLHEDSDEEGSQSWRRDPLCQWYSNREEPVPSVRTVTQEPSRKPRNIEVILDSGADVSLASNWMKKYGKKIQVKSAQLRDAKRRSVAVQKHRLIDLEFKDKKRNKEVHHYYVRDLTWTCPGKETRYEIQKCS